MTLFNQINSLLFGLFLLAISSLVYFQFTQTQAFMDNQMESDLNNTTYALSSMLKPYLEIGDAIATETMIDMIFEGGNYKKISVTWLSDQDVQVRKNTMMVSDVPYWFLNLDLFEKQSSEATISNDWGALARLEIEANPAVGYQQLWQVVNNTLMVLVVIFMLSIITIHCFLKKNLKFLLCIATQVKLIAKREFQSDLTLPQSPEFKEVVFAINSMSAQLKNIFMQLDQEVMSLKEEKLTDHVSQLPNRLYLNAHMESWLTEPGYGGLLIAKLDWLEVIHQQDGYQVRDRCIQALAQTLQQTLPHIAPSVIARVSHNEFAFLITKGSSGHLAIYLQSVIRLIKQAIEGVNTKSELLFSIGGVERCVDFTASQLLTNADSALQHAVAKKLISHWYKNEEEQDTTLPQKQLVNAIQKHQFLLQWHPVISFESGKKQQYEMYCRLKIENQTIHAGQFMPIVERLELGSLFDQHLLETIEVHSVIKQSKEPIAINLTQNSVLDEKFYLWLGAFIDRQKDCSRLHFELREDCLLAYPKQSMQLVQMIKQKGAKFGIDNFGREIGSLAYLQTMTPDYVKLDHSLSCQLKSDMEMGELQQRLELTRAVVNTARGLGCDVIITAVENQSQLQVVSSLQATAYQGLIMPVVNIG